MKNWWLAFRQWLADNADLLTAFGLLWTLGGGGIFAALAGAAFDIAQPWKTILVVSVALVGAGVGIATARIVGSRLPPPQRRRSRRPFSPEMQKLFASMTPQAQLTAFIEEGIRLRNLIPEKADDPKSSFVNMMLNYDLDYPAKVYEWEKRVWTLLNQPPLSQWRALYTYSGNAQRLGSLRGYLDERVAELKTILTKA